MMVAHCEVDLLNPPPLKHEKSKHKLKPSGYIPQFTLPEKTIFSHSQTLVKCEGCDSILCQPTDGRSRIVEGCGYRNKEV